MFLKEVACVKGDVRLSQASDRKERAAPLFLEEREKSRAGWSSAERRLAAAAACAFEGSLVWGVMMSCGCCELLYCSFALQFHVYLTFTTSPPPRPYHIAP